MHRAFSILIIGCVMLLAACGDADESSSTTPSDETPTTSSPPVTSATSTPATSTSTTSAFDTDEAVPAPAPREPTTGLSDEARELVVGSIGDDGIPVWNGDFADPFVLAVGDEFYAYSTNTWTANVPVLVANGDGGEMLDDALPELPSWASPGFTWAPSLAHVAAGSDESYVLYFTARHTESGRQCIGVATSDGPAGPFSATSDTPLICPLELGGAIDASPVTTPEGERWLLWKGDGNCCGIPTQIFIQALDESGTELIGEPTELIRNDQAWERDVVEGPTMVFGSGSWHLFYSANRWDTEDYAIGHAVCESPTGPCVKDPEPWLSSNDGATGLGGQEVLAGPFGRGALMVFHGWPEGSVGYELGQRGLFVEVIRFNGDRALMGW